MSILTLNLSHNCFYRYPMPFTNFYRLLCFKCHDYWFSIEPALGHSYEISHESKKRLYLIFPFMYIEHKNRSLIICLVSFIKRRKGILHRKLSVKSMVVGKKNQRLECDDPPQLPASSIYCSRSSLCAARMQNKLFVREH